MSSSAVAADPVAIPAPERVKRRGTPAWIGGVGYLIVLAEIVLFALTAPGFLAPSNLVTMLTQAAVYAIAAFGLTIVVIVGGDDVTRGGIDLSIGATLGFTGAIVALLLQQGIPFAAAVGIGLLLAAIAGAINGAVIVAGVRPLLVTLATMSALLSLTIVITDNVKVAVSDDALIWLRDGSLFGVPGSVLLLLVIFAVIVVVIGRTRLGVNAYAVGQNPLAAKIAGLSPGRYVFGSYIVAGVLAGIAGIAMTGRLSAALPGIGEQVLIDILLASFMSIAFSRRLVVTVSGTLFSAVFVAVLNNGFVSLGVESQWVGITKGALILVVLAVAAVRERKGR